MKQESVPRSTNEVANAFSVGLPPTLIAGPVWTSFEQFRKGGVPALEGIPRHGVATVQTKAGTFRIIRDADFQRLVGLAADVYRLQAGLTLVVKAARVALKHTDQEHVELFLSSASLIAQSPELPQRVGHESFQLTPEEL